MWLVAVGYGIVSDCVVTVACCYLRNCGFVAGVVFFLIIIVILRLKCDDTRAETRFRHSAKRTNPFKSAGASVHSTTGSRGVRISGSNAGYTMCRISV